MSEDSLAEELKWVTKERDDARRELIAYDALHGRMSVVAAAKARGWGYLVKENNYV